MEQDIHTAAKAEARLAVRLLVSFRGMVLRQSGTIPDELRDAIAAVHRLEFLLVCIVQGMRTTAEARTTARRRIDAESISRSIQ